MEPAPAAPSNAPEPATKKSTPPNAASAASSSRLPTRPSSAVTPLTQYAANTQLSSPWRACANSTDACACARQRGEGAPQRQVRQAQAAHSQRSRTGRSRMQVSMNRHEGSGSYLQSRSPAELQMLLKTLDPTLRSQILGHIHGSSETNLQHPPQRTQRAPQPRSVQPTRLAAPSAAANSTAAVDPPVDVVDELSEELRVARIGQLAPADKSSHTPSSGRTSFMPCESSRRPWRPCACTGKGDMGAGASCPTRSTTRPDALNHRTQPRQ